MAKALPRQPWCFSTLEWRILRHLGRMQQSSRRSKTSAAWLKTLRDW